MKGLSHDSIVETKIRKENKYYIMSSVSVIMNAKTEVRCGPGTSKYDAIGQIYAGDHVYVDWKEGGYYFVEYPIGNGRWKCGYALKSAFSGLVTDSEIGYRQSTNAGTRYVNKSGVYTYYGYYTETEKAGSVSYGEAVDYLGVKLDGYAFIEYDVTATGMRKRAFVVANNLSTSKPS